MTDNNAFFPEMERAKVWKAKLTINQIRIFYMVFPEIREKVSELQFARCLEGANGVTLELRQVVKSKSRYVGKSIEGLLNLQTEKIWLFRAGHQPFLSNPKRKILNERNDDEFVSYYERLPHTVPFSESLETITMYEWVVRVLGLEGAY